MNDILETVLLLALPASGKSEVRRYLKSLPPRTCRDDFHMGPSVQLDDFPYVHMMRRIDDTLSKLGAERIFFHSSERPFKNAWDWGTLIGLVNEDYADLTAKKVAKPSSAARLLFDRMEAAAGKAGIKPRLAALPQRTLQALAEALEAEAAGMLKEKQENIPDTLSGKTLVIEFARGGPSGSPLPLPAPLGYRYSLGQLAPAILEKAAILYVWVTPEQSRRKNEARADPKDPGSILHHGVPIEVMTNDYGVDDMEWLEENSERRQAVTVEARGGKFPLPIARFDNRVDKTSFLRDDPKLWSPEKVAAVHEGLRAAMGTLAAQRSKG